MPSGCAPPWDNSCPAGSARTTCHGRKVLVVPYDPTWPQIFEQLRAFIWPAVRGIAFGVEHVGSTAVPGLAAKPIIDIDVVVAPPDMSAVIDRLTMIGYRHQGDLGVDGREAFEHPPGLPRHHLYACVRGGEALTNHLAVRDFLRACPPSAAAYGALKLELAEHYADDPEGYGRAKTEFVVPLIARWIASPTT